MGRTFDPQLSGRVGKGGRSGPQGSWKKSLKDKPYSEPEKKETKISTTDPDSGYMMRDGKPEGFFYLDHRTVDSMHSIITDVHVTTGNVHDSVPYLQRLDRQRERFGFEVHEAGHA